MTSDQAALANHSRSSLYETLDMQEEKQKESESIHISSVVVGLAYTGIWNAGLVAAALQPENNLVCRDRCARLAFNGLSGSRLVQNAPRCKRARAHWQGGNNSCAPYGENLEQA